MNPQPSEALCSVITCFVIISIIIVAIKKYHETDGIIINDNIELGTINYNKTQLAPIITYTAPKIKPQKSNSSNITINTTLKKIEKRLDKIDKQIQKLPSTNIDTKKPSTPRYTKLHEDCFLALRGLGMSAKESKFIVHSTFNKHDVKTVQEFIYLALGKK